MIINTASRLGEVKEYYFSVKLKEIAAMRAQGIDVINLGIGSPDLPPSPDVIETLRTESLVPQNHKYQSYSGILELREAMARFYQKWYGVELNATNELLPLIGSKEGIMHISMTFLEAGDEVLIPNPGYPTYQSVTRLTGASIRTYDLSEETAWLPDLVALEQTDLSKVKIMWLNYPHMPTGAKATRSFFEKVVQFAKKHQILLCNDNPYSFILNEDYISILAVDGAKEVALELNSLSKAQNMAGWRVGMLAGRADYVQTILRFKSNMDSGMFKPLQLAAVKALDADEKWYADLNAIYKKRQQIAFQILEQLNCSFNRDCSGMFVWAKIPSSYASGFQLSDQLLQETGVFITPGGIFGDRGNQYIRISLCSPEEVLQQAIQRIQQNASVKVW